MSEQNISKIRTLNNSVYNIRDSVLRSIVDIDDSTSGIPQQPSDTHIATTKAIAEYVEDYVEENAGSGGLEHLLDGETEGSLRSSTSIEESEGEYELGEGAVALGINTLAAGDGSFAVGYNTHANGYDSFASGSASFAEGDNSHAEGTSTISIGDSSHAEGSSDTGMPEVLTYTIQESGDSNIYLDYTDHNLVLGSIVQIADSPDLYYVTYIEEDGSCIKIRKPGDNADKTFSTTGGGTLLSSSGQLSSIGISSHSEGVSTISYGSASHAEGCGTRAQGDNSHSEGNITFVSGNNAHVEGNHTIALGDDQHVTGRYNIEDPENEYAYIIGNGHARQAGEDGDTRSNAFAVKWDGSLVFQDGTIIYADEFSTLVQLLAKEPCIIDVSHVDRSSIGETVLAPPIAGQAIVGESVLGGSSQDVPSVGGKFIIEEQLYGSSIVLNKSWDEISTAFNNGLNCIINKLPVDVNLELGSGSERSSKLIIDINTISVGRSTIYELYTRNERYVYSPVQGFPVNKFILA